MDPTMGTAARILSAAGLQLPDTPAPLCDPAAVRAARSILGGAPAGADDEAWVKTLMRWASPDGAPRPRSLAREAGAAAPPPCRPGAIRFATAWEPLRLFSAAAATRKGWAVSGAPAAARIGASAGAGPVVLYAEEAARLSATVNHTDTGSQDVIVLPFDGFSESGAWNDGGIVWADPIQVIIDCFGLNACVRQAEALTTDWERAA